MKIIIRFILVILIVTSGINYVAQTATAKTKGQIITPSNLNVPSWWLNVSSEELMQLVYGYLSHQPDSAIIASSILISRYSENMSRKEKDLCGWALVARGNVMYHTYRDFKKSCADFHTALKIIDDDTDPMLAPNIYNNLASVYTTYGEQISSEVLTNEARKYWIKAYDISKKATGRDLCMIILINLSLNWPQLTPQQTDSVISIWDNTVITEHSVLSRFAEQRIEALKAIRDGNPTLALHHFRKQLEQHVEIDHKEMVEILALSDIASTFRLLGQPDSALKYAKAADMTARQTNAIDGEVGTKRLIAQIYGDLGQSAKVDSMMNSYYVKKDSLLTQYALDGVSDTFFTEKISAFESELYEHKHARRRQNIIIMSAVIILVIVVSFTLVLSRKNRTLDRRNKALYLQIKNTLELEEANRKETELLRSQLQQAAEAPPETKQYEKYSTSHLSDSDKASVLTKIKEVLTDTEAVCADDFSLTKLASLTGEKSNYLSMVINEYMGGNFNAVINTYRIREACRRFDEPEFQNLTIEAISRSVGFKSRTTFVNAFKKETGMTPSEYQRQARKYLTQEN